jgi:hypothetical protein
MLKNWPVIALAIALIAIIGVSCYTGPGHQYKRNVPENNLPTVGITQNDASHHVQDTQTSKHPPYWRELFEWPEGVTALAILLTLFFIGWQAMLMRQAIVSTEEASKRELRAYVVPEDGYIGNVANVPSE